MTLRLEPDNHRRLRQASSELGRSCQDILFAAMNRYLDGLDLVEASDEGFFKLEKG